MGTSVQWGERGADHEEGFIRIVSANEIKTPT